MQGKEWSPAMYAQVVGDMIPPSQQRETTGHTPQGTIVSRFCAITSLLTYTNETIYARNETRELCMQRTVRCSVIGYESRYIVNVKRREEKCTHFI